MWQKSIAFSSWYMKRLDVTGGRGRSSVAVGIHVLLEISIHVLEDEHELVLGVDDIVQGEDVFVLELFH